jgi:hypothetical protein
MNSDLRSGRAPAHPEPGGKSVSNRIPDEQELIPTENGDLARHLAKSYHNSRSFVSIRG